MEIGRDARSLKSLSRHTLEQMVTSISEGILLVDAQDPNLPIVFANPAYETLSGYSAEELIGSPFRLAKRDNDGQQELERLKAAIGRAEACAVRVADLRKDGTSWLSEISVEPIYNARGDLKYFLCIQKPIRERSGDSSNVEVSLLERELGRARQKIANLDKVDPATGLLRFGYFQDVLRRDLAVARRDQRFITVLLFEIVDFEAYRQTFGSKAADSCQRMIGAQVMRTLRRAGDLCSRLDDSTLVASVLGQEPDEVQRLAEQISDNVRRLGLHNPRSKFGRYVTIRSAIVGCPPGAEEDTDAVIARAQADLRAVAEVAEATARAEGL
jgi:PAS domain S-box-containing protein/diguanylate cyclase (GGDEF)-like protein